MNQPLFQDVAQRIKRKNKLFFSRKSACLQNLNQKMETASHLTLVLWAFEQAQPIVTKLESRYMEENCFADVYNTCLAWAHGEVKMPFAKRTILDCHAFAKQISSAVDIAYCHALGQGCSTVHVKTHAIGLVFYELTALVLQNQKKDYEPIITKQIQHYEQRLDWWCEHTKEYETQSWNKFLLKTKP